MRKFFYILNCSLFIIACNSNTIIKKPENLIPEDKMIDILTDSYIAKTARASKNINGDRNINYLSYIYQNHETDSATFHTSLKYYSANISLHENLLKKVQFKLEKQLAIVNDSLSKINNDFEETNDSFNEIEQIEAIPIEKQQ